MSTFQPTPTLERKGAPSLIRENSVYWLNHPYFDLYAEPITFQRYLYVKALFAEIANWQAGIPRYPSVTTYLGQYSFRQDLYRQCGLPQDRVFSALDLPDEVQSDRWQHFCEEIRCYSSLDMQRKVLLLRLLTKLCLYQDVLNLEPEGPTEESIQRNEFMAEIGYLRLFAQFMLYEDKIPAINFRYQEMERLATLAPGNVRLNAWYMVAIYTIKFDYQPQHAEHALFSMEQAVMAMRSSVEDFTYLDGLSRYHRVNAFLPQMRQDLAGTQKHLHLAQQTLDSMMPRATTPYHHYVCEQLQQAIFESSSKTALWAGDLPTAEAYARQCVLLCPQDSTHLMELGEILLQQQRLQEAAELYQQATHYGPRGIAIAWYMLGTCFQSMGDHSQAVDAYRQSLKFDPFGISAAEGMLDVAQLTNDTRLKTESNALISQISALAAKQHGPGKGTDLKAYQHFL